MHRTPLLRRLRLHAMRAALRPLCRWRPADAATPGYTVTVSVAASLMDLLGANLTMLERQDRQGLAEVLLVVDKPRDAAAAAHEASVRQRHPDLPIRWAYFTRTQARVLDSIGWGWAYCWLSWCIAIAHCSTRHLLIHDLDLLPLRRDFLRRRYDAIRDHGVQYLGMQPFAFNGFEASDGLMASNELFIDAAFVREHFRPIDLFLRVGRFRGRPVTYDLMLVPQSRLGRAEFLPLRPLEIVHPSQMICQYTAFRRRRAYTPLPTTSLPLIPYFLHLAGRPEELRALIDRLPTAERDAAPMLGGELDLTPVGPGNIRALATMADEVEHELFGHTRAEVRAYFDALERLVGGDPTRIGAAA